ncbi:MBL fold metallo-hydrolase [Patulibacter sp. NPDC049589]|uniref:MBL fold metallo-hydrolase n=1 Tax=Patulibacter sp. NPDC049589 TaxID=3154731 RepID=UPI003437C763
MTDVQITYVGGPTVLIEVGGWRILTDPTFDPPGKRYFFGWGTASKKLQGPAVAFDDLGPIDAVLISHDHHGDNLDPTGRELLPRMGQIVTTAPGAKRLDGDAIGLQPWQTTTLASEGKVDIEITATPCRHGPPGSRPIVGEVVGFALQWEGQEHGVLWITGDTVLYDGVREVPKKLDVGTVIVHMGGVTFPWLSGPLRYTMNAQEAVELCGALDPTTIVPIHFEGWKHFRQGRAAAKTVIGASPLADRTRWLEPGTAESIGV